MWFYLWRFNVDVFVMTGIRNSFFPAEKENECLEKPQDETENKIANQPNVCF